MRPRRMGKKKKKTDTKSTIMSVSELSVNVPEAKERTLSWFLTSAKQSGIGDFGDGVFLGKKCAKKTDLREGPLGIPVLGKTRADLQVGLRQFGAVS